MHRLLYLYSHQRGFLCSKVVINTDISNWSVCREQETVKSSVLAPMSKYYPVPSDLENHNGIDGKSQKQKKFLMDMTETLQT